MRSGFIRQQNKGVTINNLQHARSGSTSANGGQRAAVIAMFDLTGQVPTCLSGCTTTTSASGVTVASGQCYNGGICYATGATDTFRACFSCNAATSQTVMQGPDTTNHCYIGGSCFPTGAMAPAKVNGVITMSWLRDDISCMP